MYCLLDHQIYIEWISSTMPNMMHPLQVIFSSTVMYANFKTIAHRRVIAKQAEEHLARCADERETQYSQRNCNAVMHESVT